MQTWAITGPATSPKRTAWLIAHSFGTYLVAKYLTGFEIVPVPIDTLILTGSILNETLDLEVFKGRAALIVNEMAPNDTAVKFAPFVLPRDPFVGRSGDKGFTYVAKRLEQRKSEIFDHYNVIRRDVIVRHWMPTLEANIGRGYREAVSEIVQIHRSVE